MYKRLSYNINADAPGWPGNPKIELETRSSISNGDNANTFNVKLFNHFGSHMDGPKHFNDDGPRLGELAIETFIYDRPLLVDIPKTFKQLIQVEDLKPFEAEIKKSDLLMIRSGFSKERATNAQRYAHEGVGISSEACKYIMDTFPNLKAVAMDWISLASYAHGDDGVTAHHYLLGKFHDHYVCIIEDVNLDQLKANEIKKVFSIPLFIDGLDSSPVTIIAEIQ